MAFFPDIDEDKTIANAKRKLKEYPRWKRVAGESGSQKVTQTFTFDLRNPGGSPNKAVERLAINRVDAMAELDAIEFAINNLHDPMYRRILFERYLKNKVLILLRTSFLLRLNFWLSECSMSLLLLFLF